VALPEGQTVESAKRRVSGLAPPARRPARAAARPTSARPEAGRIASIQATARRSAVVVVPIMLFTSSMLMALAWLGHLKFEHWPFTQALFACWLLVLPEYFLNISAIRIGYRFYSGAQMATFRLCSGVLCVALVSRFVLGEELTDRKLLGFGIMVVAMVLVGSSRPDRADGGGGSS
jgi:uncharacterized protein (DUF486 family)